jgi:subtilisin family serine protease
MNISIRSRYVARAAVLSVIVSGVVTCLGASAHAQTIDARAALGIGITDEPVDLGNGVIYFGYGNGLADIKQLMNVNAADTTNADQLRSGGGLGLNLTGTGITVGVWDGGDVRSTHQQLTGRVTVVDGVGTSTHSTHVAGTIGGDGTGNAAALGMAPAVLIRSRDFNNDKTEMATDANLIDISNHSYGSTHGWTTGLDWGVGPVDTWFVDRTLNAVEDPGFGKYSAGAKDLDTVLHNNPKLLSVWSAGNDRNDAFTNASGLSSYVTFLSADPDGPGGFPYGSAGFYHISTGTLSAPPGDGNGGTGYDSLSGDQTAKNSLVVGAILDITVDPYSNANVVHNSFSSYGPTDDGRMKPDVMGNGNALTSAGDAADNSYVIFSGTSMASPNVAGTSVLLLEHYKNTHGATIPNSATQKGLIIHTAFDSGTAGPDYASGFGVVDGAAAANFVTDEVSFSPESFIVEGDYNVVPDTIEVISDGSGPLKATLVWTDPAPVSLPGSGLDDATSVLVNNLDLLITGPGGTFFPWTLDPNNPALGAVRTGANSRDNVEQVLIDLPGAGTYTITVSGGAFSQNYSLLYSGVTAIPEPSTMMLLVIGLLGFGLKFRRQRDRRDYLIS